jgi:3-isopropylmalate/(R)-2-methylmalate dehydratase small subunit
MQMKKIRGRVWKFGDNINTDNMSPAQYIPYGIREVARHCLEAVRSEFPQEVKVGDVVLGGENFGTGSSRETAAAALKELGVALVITKSFARIFFRNAIDIALPVIICPELYDSTNDGDIVSADLTSSKIINESKGKEFRTDPIPQIMMEILQAGGLINYVLKEKW